MTELFTRKARVQVDGLLVEELRVTFKVEKSLDEEPNKAEVAIFNLAEKTRRGIQKKGANVILEAGYEDNQAVVFRGQARRIEHLHQGPDWVTKLECGDGEVAYAGAQMNVAFGKNAAAIDVARAAAKLLSTDIGSLEKHAAKLQAKYASGYTAKGRASDELSKVLKGAGLSFSIQDGRLQVLERRGHSGERAIVLNAASGLLGSPEHGTTDKEGKQPLLKVESLLMPQLLPGRLLFLEARSHNGQYRISKLTHHGDTHGGKWVTVMEGQLE